MSIRRRLIGSVLGALTIGAVVAAGLVVTGQGATSPTAPPDVSLDGETLTWSPVAGAQTYTLVAQVGGRTTQRSVRCCSFSLRDFERALATYFLRADIPGGVWSRPQHPGGGGNGSPGSPPRTSPSTPGTSTPGTSPSTAPPSTLPSTTLPPTTSPGTTPPGTTSPGSTPPNQPPAPGDGSPSPAGGATGKRVCDAVPATYPAAPAGAVVVDPAVVGDLSRKTASSPAGTTFWLKPGTHTLGGGQYDQVQPKAGNTYLGAPGAILDGKGVNAFAFTQQAANVTIRNLTVQNFVAPRDQGVVNHDSGDGWVIENSTIQNNKGAALMAGARQQVLNSCLRNNGQYGLNAYKAGDSITGLVVTGNEIVGNNTDDWESKVSGCGCTGGIKFWAVNRADVRGNWVHDNRGPGLWADTNNNDFLIQDNVIESNDGAAVFYETSYNLVMTGNTLRRNAIVEGKSFAQRGDNFPVAAVYLSESGGDAAVPARTAKIDVTRNYFVDNWSGVTAWENADRFCNSPANTSSGYCTKRVPSKASCAQPGIASAPLYDTCRWKTQNVAVHANTFSVDRAAIGCADNFCGRQAVLSNYGTYPSWSPYQKTVVQQAITFDQNNRWYGNTYSGPWSFMAFETARSLTAAQWQATPYGQDNCSNFSGGQPTC